MSISTGHNTGGSMYLVVVTSQLKMKANSAMLMKLTLDLLRNQSVYK